MGINQRLKKLETALESDSGPISRWAHIVQAVNELPPRDLWRLKDLTFQVIGEKGKDRAYQAGAVFPLPDAMARALFDFAYDTMRSMNAGQLLTMISDYGTPEASAEAHDALAHERRIQQMTQWTPPESGQREETNG